MKINDLIKYIEHDMARYLHVQFSAIQLHCISDSYNAITLNIVASCWQHSSNSVYILKQYSTIPVDVDNAYKRTLAIP